MLAHYWADADSASLEMHRQYIAEDNLMAISTPIIIYRKSISQLKFMYT